MKRKLLIVFLAIVAVFACAFGLTACDIVTGGGNSDDNPSGTQYTVTFNANGGTFSGGDETLTQKIDSGAKLTAPLSPVCTGSAFGGWATDKNGKTLWKFDSDTVTENITLYAVWEEQSAAIIRADGATIDENKMSVFMLVDKDTDSVSLSNKIVCSSDSVWKLYYDKLGLTEIPTKIAVQKTGELNGGDNVFYIVVTSSNGSQVNVYELTVHRVFPVTINFYDNKNNFLKADNMYSGSEYGVDFTPEIAGYTFNCWKDEDGKEVTAITPYSELNLYADCMANTYTVSYDANGGNGTVSSVKISSGQGFTANDGSAFDRTSFTLLNFNTEPDGSGTEIALSGNISDYDFAKDLTLYAIWQCHFTYTYDSFNYLVITGMINKSFTDIIIPETIDDKKVASIQEWAFMDYTNLKTVVIPDNVSMIGGSAFSGCSSLTSITIPFIGNYRQDSSRMPDYLFGYIFGKSQYSGGVYTNQRMGNDDNVYYIPASLKHVTVNGGRIDYGFFRCESLTSITLGEGITRIDSYAFSGCDGLTGITIPDSVTYIGQGAFAGCDGLTGITIPDSVTDISIQAFAACSNLKSIKIGNGTTKIGFNILRSCGQLTDIQIDANNPVYYAENLCIIEKESKKLVLGLENSRIPRGVVSIGDSAFSSCEGLTSITIPDGVTSIGDSAFDYCRGLTSITIPDSVTSIGVSVFAYSGLTDIHFEGTIAQWRDIKKGSIWTSWDSNTGKCTIHCTDGDILK